MASWTKSAGRHTSPRWLTACRDPRTPWPAKALAAGIVAYAFSPIDLIPDFIPVLGYLDELVLLPLGVLLPGHARSLAPQRPRFPFSGEGDKEILTDNCHSR